MWLKINELVTILQSAEMIKYKNKVFELSQFFIKFSELISENKLWHFSWRLKWTKYIANEQNIFLSGAFFWFLCWMKTNHHHQLSPSIHKSNSGSHKSYQLFLQVRELLHPPLLWVDRFRKSWCVPWKVENVWDV